MRAADDDPEGDERLERARRAAEKAKEPADCLAASDLAEAMWLCPYHSAEELNAAYERYADQIAVVRRNHPRARVGGILAHLVYFRG